jgi:hypothetical protein
VCRLSEPGRTRRRHSKFWIGLYGENWLIAHDCCWEWVESMIGLVRNKQPFYQRGLKAIKGVAELQYESMMDNKVNFYEMP